MPLVCWRRVHVRGHSERQGKHTYLRPDGEVVLVEREVLLELADRGLVLEEEDGAVAGLEARELLVGGGPLLLGDDRLEDLAGNVPELLVLSLEEHDDAGALRVERGRDVEHNLLHDLLNACIGHGALVREGVVRAALLDRLEEGACGGHGACL